MSLRASPVVSVILMALILLPAVASASQGYPMAFSFEYHGCAAVDLTCFSDATTLSGTRPPPEACKEICQGYSIAALFPEYVISSPGNAVLTQR